MEPHERLRRLRDALDLRQAHVAARMGIARPTYTKVEIGQAPLTDAFRENLARALSFDRKQLDAYLDGTSEIDPLLKASKTETDGAPTTATATAHAAGDADSRRVTGVSPFLESALVAAFRSNVGASLSAFKNAERTLLQIREAGLERRLFGDDFAAAFCLHLLDVADGSPRDNPLDMVLKVCARVIELELARTAGIDIETYRQERAKTVREAARAYDYAGNRDVMALLGELVSGIRAKKHVEKVLGIKWQTIVDVSNGLHCADDPEWREVISAVPSLKIQMDEERRYRTDVDYASAVEGHFSSSEIKDLYGDDDPPAGDNDGENIPF